jgi:hypothetical protein
MGNIEDKFSLLLSTNVFSMTVLKILNSCYKIYCVRQVICC